SIPPKCASHFLRWVHADRVYPTCAYMSADLGQARSGSRSASLHSPGTRDLVSRTSERERAKIRDPGATRRPESSFQLGEGADRVCGSIGVLAYGSPFSVMRRHFHIWPLTRRATLRLSLSAAISALFPSWKASAQNRIPDELQARF